MKTKSLCRIVLLSICGFFYGSGATADTGGETYFGFQYAQVEEDDLDLEPTAGIFRIGRMSANGVGIEGRIGIGLEGDDISGFDPFLGDISIELEIDNLIGIYLVGQAEAGAVSLYGIIGFTQVDFDIDADAGILGSASISEDESDLSFGFGVNFEISDRLGFNLEYMQYLDEDEFEASAISIGLLF